VDLFHHPAGLFFPLHDETNVMTVHDLIPLRFPQFCPGAGDWFGESFSNVQEMDMLLTPSEYTKQDIVEMLEVSEERIQVTPEAAHAQYHPISDRELVDAVLSKYDLAGRPYVLHIGMLMPTKNQAGLVKAFHHLKQEEPCLEHQLVLIGRKSEIFEPVFDAIRDLRMETQVRWLECVPFQDLPFFFNGADVFVFPSLYEGFGLPPLEAMACGTPVVASGTSSLTEVVGDAGLLVNPQDPEEVAGAMRRVLTDDRLRASLREKGLRRARTFSWEKTARLTLTSYEQARALSRGKRRPKRRSVQLRGKFRTSLRQHVIDSWVAFPLGRR
jgi:glycosyltransferase involved in cell wall biosynthesis